MSHEQRLADRERLSEALFAPLGFERGGDISSPPVHFAIFEVCYLIPGEGSNLPGLSSLSACFS